MSDLHTIDICITTCDSLIDNTVRLLNSLMATKDKNTFINLHVIQYKLAEENMKYIDAFANSNVNIMKYDATKHMDFYMLIANNSFKKKSKIAEFVLDKVLFNLPLILKDVKKILFLDSTTYVRKDLAPMFEIKLMKREFIAATKDAAKNYSKEYDNKTTPIEDIDICKYRKTIKKYVAFNQCVLDLEKMRKNNFSDLTFNKWCQYLPYYAKAYDIMNLLMNMDIIHYIGNIYSFPLLEYYDMSRYSKCHNIRWFNELYDTGKRLINKRYRPINRKLMRELIDESYIWNINPHISTNYVNLQAQINAIENELEDCKKKINEGTAIWQFESIDFTQNYDKNVHIAMAFNAQYSMLALRSISDILRYKKEDTDLELHLFVVDLQTDVLNILQKINEKENVKIHITDAKQYVRLLDEKYAAIDVKNKFCNAWVTGISGLKMLMPNLLNDLNRVIWIDCDNLLRLDFAELYNIDIEKNLLAAPIDNQGIHRAERNPSYKICKTSIDYKTYFDVNIVLMNLEAMRKKKFVDQCIDNLNTFKHVKKDKDIMNSICYNSVYLLDSRYDIDLPSAVKGIPEYSDIKLYNSVLDTGCSDMQELGTNAFIIHLNGDKNFVMNNDIMKNFCALSNQNLAILLEKIRG